MCTFCTLSASNSEYIWVIQLLYNERKLQNYPLQKCPSLIRVFVQLGNVYVSKYIINVCQITIHFGLI